MRAVHFLFVTALVFSPTASWAQALGSGRDDGISSLRVLAVLVFLAFLVGVAFFLMKMRGVQPLGLWKLAEERRMKHIETLRISPQAGLCLISIDGEERLILFTSAGATLVDHGGNLNGKDQGPEE